ncbi:MAG: SCO family protein [Candidatus Eremiobacteraeota bacterium]|nr:SCO family protein [Candidatus Eremiobacteraeota bacterium]
MRWTPPRALLLGVALALCAIAAFVTIAAHRRSTSAVAKTFAGTPVDPPKPAADFTLTDAGGHPAHLVIAGQPLEFLFFGYTHCPDECPLAMASLGRAYRKLSPPERADTRVVFVTVDPARDTPSVVRRYVTGFDQDFIGLTGSSEQLARVRAAYGVQIDSNTKEIAHGDAIYAIDAHGNVVLIYPPDVAPKALAADAALLTK